MIKGIDISKFQGKPDFNAVKKAGYEFVWMKATEGVGYVDPVVKTNWPKAKAAKLVVGLYHFARPDLNPPETEAEFFAKVAGPLLTRYDLMALDLEVAATGKQFLSTWEYVFLGKMTALLGFAPFRYSYVSFFKPHGLPPARTGNPNWIAAYQKARPTMPNVIWQNADNDQVPGIKGNVDEDLFYGTRAQLIAYGRKS